MRKKLCDGCNKEFNFQDLTMVSWGSTRRRILTDGHIVPMPPDLEGVDLNDLTSTEQIMVKHGLEPHYMCPSCMRAPWGGKPFDRDAAKAAGW